MSDKREAILVRLREILGEAFADGWTVGRNLADLPDEALPAVILMDGDEDADEAARDRGWPPRQPYRIVMSPTIHGIITGDEASIGAAMNDFRGKVLGAVMDDPDLAALTFNGLGIRYDGCATGFASDGARLIGEIGVSFAITYLLKPGDV